MLAPAHHEDHSGFTLLEMVVALGILIVLTVGGVLAYNGIQQSAREGATRAAAKSVHTEAIAYDIDNNGSTKPTDAADEYNDQGQPEGEDPTIKAAVYQMADGSLCTVATYIEYEIESIFGAPSIEECRGDETPAEGETPFPNDSLESGDFISTWNLATSDYCNNNTGGRLITIPIKGKADISIDWGDGNVKDYVDPIIFPEHCYTETTGLKTVKIKGGFENYGASIYSWTANGIVSVDKWENTGTVNARHAFHGAKNLVSVDSPPSTVKDMYSMFQWNDKLTALTGNWDTSNVTNMSRMFYGTNFNQDISNWDVSKVTDYTGFRGKAKLSTPHTPKFTPYEASEEAVFVSTWNPKNGTYCVRTDGSTGYKVIIPIKGTADMTIDWGDGTVKDYVNPTDFPENCYLDLNTKTVKIDGTFDSFGAHIYSWTPSAILSVNKWGNTETTNLSYGFHHAINLTSVDSPPSTVANMYSTFQNNSRLTQLTGKWDTSNVTNMDRTFSNTAVFNQDISHWDVYNVDTYTDFRSKSKLATENTPQFEVYEEMSRSDADFISTWNTSYSPICPHLDGSNGKTITLPIKGKANITIDWGDGTIKEYVNPSNNVEHCYLDSKERTIKIKGTFEWFGDSTSYWTPKSVLSVDYWGETGTTNTSMAFIGAENVHTVDAPPSSVNNMSQMFQGTLRLKTLTGEWDTRNVTNMYRMFLNSRFSQNISNWNVEKVTNSDEFNRNSSLRAPNLPTFK